MAEIVVLRPPEAAARTATRLSAAGFTPLVAPLARIVPKPPRRLAEGDIAGLVVTSAAALDAVADHPDLAALRAVPLWAVGTRTAERAATLGFAVVRTGPGDGAGLATMLAADGRRDLPYLYLSGEEIAADLSALAAPAGVMLVRRIVYGVAPERVLPEALATALRAGTPGAVLHFSARSAATYLALAGAAGLMAASLAPDHLCISARVAAPLAAAGAATLRLAAEPTEEGLLVLLGRQPERQRIRNGTE